MKLLLIPWAIVAALGVMAIAVSAGAVTVKVALLEVMPLNTAVTLVVPCANEAAIPVAFTLATAALPDTQVTEFEILPVVESE